MYEKELTENPNKKRPNRVREPPSVPFLWEVKPGTPKKDWKPAVSTISHSLPKPPPKLIASVPFVWEERPGKPLPSSSKPEFEPVPPFPAAELISFQSDNNKYSSYDGDGDEGTDLGLETFNFGTDESFSSAPSFMANCLLSSLSISTAVPMEETSNRINSNQMETPSSPDSEADSIASSYATGNSSLVGSTFLECLFPLLEPNSSYFEKAGYSEMGSFTPQEMNTRAFGYESTSNATARKTMTLGELILMSKRRSYRRKAVQMRKSNVSMEFIKKRAFGCFMFGRSSEMIKSLNWKKKTPLRLKLV